ncbi:lipoyl domain-containing protein [Candidatus Bipolaricaulota bacterium]|nr:lipoyl domain-containing protein [Candidatus Bipolaricaulota bacterium]
MDSDVSAKSKLLLPDLGDVKQIKIIEWLKKPGELVAAGEAVVEVETEKATFVIEAEKEGQLTRILVHAGATVKSGDVLAEIMLAAL